MRRDCPRVPARVAGTFLLCLLPLSASTAPPPRIAIIIDDLGYRAEAGRRAVELPGPVACAFLPDAPRAQSLARLARDRGKEVLLHLPMQAMSAKGAEPSAMTMEMSRARFDARFAEALDSVPYATGVNNHQGSLLTRHPAYMRWLMEAIQARDGLYFVDSYTTHRSVALRMAAETGVPAVRRDVFLDPDDEPGTLVREFERLKRIARERGSAVGIGHPHAATLEFLERELPLLREQGFELVPVSALLDERLRTSANATTLSNQNQVSAAD